MPTSRILEASGGSPTLGDWACAGAASKGITASASQRVMAILQGFCLLAANLSIRSPPRKRGSSLFWIPACAGMSGRPLRVHIPAVDRNRLTGHEIALGGSKKDQRAEQILRLHVALERARGDGAPACGLNMTRILVHDR